MAASSSSSSRPGCVVHEADVPKKTLLDRFGADGLRHGADGVADVYKATRQQLGHAAGAQALGCSLMEVAAGGCTAFPYHAHAANEEAVYVLSGEGLMRMPAGDFTVKAGDYIALLTGEANAHQLWNFHPSEPLRYLCLSTEIQPEVVVSSSAAVRACSAQSRYGHQLTASVPVCLLLPQLYPDSGKVGAYCGNMKSGIYLSQSLPYLKGEGNRYSPRSQNQG